MQASSFFIGPHKTPTSVKWLIWITAALSFLSPVLTYLCERFWHLPGPGAWFALSLVGLQKGWLWQPITYFFLHSAGIGISLALLISIIFHMLLLWFSGSEIAYRFGNKQFLLFYLGSGLVAGLVGSLILFLFSSPAVLVGSSPPVFALMTLWAMLNPNLELFFFFLIRIRAKWLVALYLGLALLMNLSYGDFIAFCADLTAILFAFLIGLFVWKLENPFPLNLDLPKRKTRTPPEEKIIDITPVREDDDLFMDQMLDKIHRSGDSSLTPRERDRMQKISNRKKKKS